MFSTQSTHKLLAGLSQASQILVQNSVERELDRNVFNEAYLMHTSTSPQYSIIASCDVAAAMMEAPGGTALVEESITEALDFRRDMLDAAKDLARDADAEAFAAKIHGAPARDADNRVQFIDEVDGMRRELVAIGDFHPGRIVAAAHDEVRKHVAFMGRDRALDGDVAAAVRMVESGVVLAVASNAG